jgi:hypothetical protein
MVHETQGAMVCWDRTSLFLIEWKAYVTVASL